MLALITVVMENFDAVRVALRVGGPPPPGLLGSASGIPEALVEQMGGWLLVASMWGDALLQVDPAIGPNAPPLIFACGPLPSSRGV